MGEREVREESGYLVKAIKLLACWDRNKRAHPAIQFHAYKLLFLCGEGPPYRHAYYWAGFVPLTIRS